MLTNINTHPLSIKNYLILSFSGGFTLLFRRWVWEFPQHFLGLIYGCFLIFIGRPTQLTTYKDWIIISGSGFRGSVSLGSFIHLIPYDFECRLQVGMGGYTFMHELGHTFQSKKLGWLYVFVVGIPSLLGAEWTELDANAKASDYFEREEGFYWDDNYYSVESRRHKYSFRKEYL